MKDFTLPEHDLDKVIVKESIKGIERIREESGVKSHIRGGLAVSSYLPVSKRRSTIDLDFTLLWGGTCDEFRKVISPFVDYIECKGWKAKVKKTNKTYDISVKSPHDILIVQHPRRTRKNFETNLSSLEREFDNERYLVRGSSSYYVLSPEDLVLHKSKRILIFSNRFDLNFPEDYHFEDIDQISDDLRKRIVKLGKSADKKDVIKLRMCHDVWDIKALAEYRELDMHYFNKSLRGFEGGIISYGNVHRLLDYIGIQKD